MNSLGAFMKRLATLAVLTVLLLGPGPTALAEPEAKPREAPTLSKADLADSYKPSVVNGMPWYRSATAVKLHNERRGESARPILLLRILGDFDGKT